jgi:hypothetical protein
MSNFENLSLAVGDFNVEVVTRRCPRRWTDHRSVPQMFEKLLACNPWRLYEKGIEPIRSVLHRSLRKNYEIFSRAVTSSYHVIVPSS